MSHLTTTELSIEKNSDNSLSSLFHTFLVYKKESFRFKFPNSGLNFLSHNY